MQELRKFNLALAILLGRVLPPAGGMLDRQARTLRRRRTWATSGAGENEKARRRLQLARGLLSFGPHGRGQW